MNILPIYKTVKRKTNKMLEDNHINKDNDQSMDEININENTRIDVFSGSGLSGYGIDITIDKTPYTDKKKIKTRVTRQWEFLFPEKIKTDEQQAQYLQKFEKFPRCTADNIDGEIMTVYCDAESEKIEADDNLKPMIDHEINILYEKIQKVATEIDKELEKEE